jgi:hypothetical protein
MTNEQTKPHYISLHRLCTLSGRSRVTLLLRLQAGELIPDAVLETDGRELPLFATGKIADAKCLRLRKTPRPINPLL